MKFKKTCAMTLWYSALIMGQLSITFGKLAERTFCLRLLLWFLSSIMGVFSWNFIVNAVASNKWRCDFRYSIVAHSSRMRVELTWSLVVLCSWFKTSSSFHATVARSSAVGPSQFSGPMAWNALPDSIRDTALSTCSFRRYLKTLRFSFY